jgi:hypothetical protein
MWPTGGAWLSTHLWEHYLFSGDREFLTGAYPLLKGSAQFFLDTLVVESKHGWSASPHPVSGRLSACFRAIVESPASQTVIGWARAPRARRSSK